MAQKDDQSSTPETGKAAEDVLELARERFKRAVEAESENRKKQDDDIRFEAASPDDPWQWPEADRKAREASGRPCLTINKLPQHKKQVTNDIRQNRPSIKYRAADDKADPKAAEILTGLARHIEANSDADVAYDTAADHMVGHGVGYVRVLTDYVSENSFDQDIYIKRVRDWRKVWLDCDAEDPAGSDAEWGFIEEKIGETEFKEEYPKADPVDWSFVDGDWFSASDKGVRVAEYYAFERKDATLLMWASGATSFKGEQLPQGVFMGELPIKQRSLKRKTLVWRKITGAQVLEKREYNWKYIPIARAIGNEALVDGQHIVSGLIRNAKDATRMYNVAASAITERVMLAPKAPWDGPAEAFEGHDEWASANTQNHAYLPWNHIDSNGQPLPRPTRVQPATVEPGLQQVLLQAADDIKSTTGQYDASLGQRSNETSGKAIMARQREGDTGTYHYGDNLARMVRLVARIVLDIIPTVFDTRRIARILGEDASEDFALADPELPSAYQEAQGNDGKTVKMFNPNFGTYDVVVSTGPGFTTRRVEAFEAMAQMTQANPQLWQVIGDQLVRNMDWPGAEEMAERLKVTLLPQVQQMLGEQGQETQIPPHVQQQIEQMGQQLQQLGQALENAAAEADKTRNEGAKLTLEGEKIEVERYRAETERMTALAPAVTPEQVQAIVMQTVREILTNQGPPASDEPPEPMPVMPEMPQGPGPMGSPGMASFDMSDPPPEAMGFLPAGMPQGMPTEQAFAPQEPQGF